MTSPLKFLRAGPTLLSHSEDISNTLNALLSHINAVAQTKYMQLKASREFTTLYVLLCIVIFFKKVTSQKHNSVKAKKDYNCLTLRDVLI